jgi:uncharacterized protein (DUF433 family)
MDMLCSSARQIHSHWRHCLLFSIDLQDCQAGSHLSRAPATLAYGNRNHPFFSRVLGAIDPRSRSVISKDNTHLGPSFGAALNEDGLQPKPPMRDELYCPEIACRPDSSARQAGCYNALRSPYGVSGLSIHRRAEWRPLCGEYRCALDSVIIRFQEGASPDKIAQSFPTLKLSQVYGVIAYYLENEKTINDYIVEGEREIESTIPLSQANPELFARLEAARRQIGSSTACGLVNRPSTFWTPRGLVCGEPKSCLARSGATAREDCDLSRSTDDDALFSRALGGGKIESCCSLCPREGSSSRSCWSGPHRERRSGAMPLSTFRSVKSFYHFDSTRGRQDSGERTAGRGNFDRPESCPIIVPINGRFSDIEAAFVLLF